MALLDTFVTLFERRVAAVATNTTPVKRGPLKLALFCITVIIVGLYMTVNSIIQMDYQSRLDQMAISAGLCQEHNVGPLQYYRFDRYDKCK